MCASLPNLVIPANAGNLKRDINPASLDSRLVEGDEKNELAHIVATETSRSARFVFCLALARNRIDGLSVQWRRCSKPPILPKTCLIVAYFMCFHTFHYDFARFSTIPTHQPGTGGEPKLFLHIYGSFGTTLAVLCNSRYNRRRFPSFANDESSRSLENEFHPRSEVGHRTAAVKQPRCVSGKTCSEPPAVAGSRTCLRRCRRDGRTSRW